MVPRTRMLPVADALRLLEEELGRHRLEAVTWRGGGERAAVVQCELRDSRGHVVIVASGYGEGLQADVSAMFEAWQHYRHQESFAAARSDPGRMRVMSPAEILSQEPLHDDEVLARLARDHSGARVACLRFEPFVGADVPLWYPAFARFPWIKQYPVPGDGGYAPYLRYATPIGTAAGTSEDEALLAGLAEAVEGDAVSMAFIDWYVRGDPPRRVFPEDLPARLRALLAGTGCLLGAEPILFDISSDDLNVPAFIAIPSRPGPPGVCGEGSSLIPAYAAERALQELAQADVAVDMPAHQALMDVRLADIRWPVIERCARIDPGELAGRAVRARPRRPSWWEGPSLDVPGQLSLLASRLVNRGLRAYRLRWNPGDTVPVTTVLVPGLEVFFLAHKAIPVAPGTRGLRRARAS